MKLYDSGLAPNPKKVRVFLAEKGLSIPLEPVDILAGGARSPEYLKINPIGGVPLLQLDDGSYLGESLAIMEYLDELHPTPPMIGTTPIERARTREIERWCELGVLNSIAQIFQHTSPMFASRLKQSPDAAANARTRLEGTLKVLDARIGGNAFVAGKRPSIADCTLLAAFGLAAFAQVEIDPAFANVVRWHTEFQERPRGSNRAALHRG